MREDYLQKSAGVCCIGIAGSKTILGWVGPPDTLKTTIANLMRHALGLYGASLPVSAIVVSRWGMNNAHTSSEMALARSPYLVEIEELPKQVEIDTSKAKNLVGGGDYWLAEKGKPGAYYQQRCVVLLNSNHEIRADDSDDAFHETRLRPFFFRNVVTKDERDGDAIHRLPMDQAVLDAVFTWMVDGAVAYIRSGKKLEAPEAFRARTRESRNNNSLEASWIEQHVRRGGYDATFRFDVIYAAWREWCRGESVRTMRPVSPGRPQAFGDVLQRMGFVFEKNAAGVRVWHGGTFGPSVNGTGEEIPAGEVPF